MLAEKVSARAWPGPPGPITPAGLGLLCCRGNPRWKCDNFSASYGLRLSSRRSGVSTPCMTVSAGVTSCGRHGSGSGRTVGPPGWIGSPWRTWRRSTGFPGCSGSSRLIFAQARTVPRPPGAWISRNRKAARGRWAFLRFVTGWPSRRPRSCWSRSSRRTSRRARTGSGRSGRLCRRWSGSVPGSSRGASSSRNLISGTSSARSAMTGCSPRWESGYRTGGCSSWSACGCKQGWWWTGSSSGRSPEPPRAAW